MKNNIVFYITFLLLCLFSACTKVDKPVYYPVTAGPLIPKSGEGTLTIGTSPTKTTALAVNGNIIQVTAGDKTIILSFNNSSFAAGSYTTKAAVTADNEVSVQIKDPITNELYQVESDKTLLISIDNTTQVTIISLGASKATAVNPQTSPIDVQFSFAK